MNSTDSKYIITKAKTYKIEYAAGDQAEHQAKRCRHSFWSVAASFILQQKNQQKWSTTKHFSLTQNWNRHLCDSNFITSLIHSPKSSWNVENATQCNRTHYHHKHIIMIINVLLPYINFGAKCVLPLCSSTLVSPWCCRCQQGVFVFRWVGNFRSVLCFIFHQVWIGAV